MLYSFIHSSLSLLPPPFSFFPFLPSSPFLSFILFPFPPFSLLPFTRSSLFPPPPPSSSFLPPSPPCPLSSLPPSPGACIVALGEKVGALYSADDSLRHGIEAAAKRTDEGKYDEMLNDTFNYWHHRYCNEFVIHFLFFICVISTIYHYLLYTPTGTCHDDSRKKKVHLTNG